MESQKDGKCAVGSLNLTQRGLTKNKELLAFCDYQIDSKSYASKFSEHFKKYVEKILNDKDTTYRVSDSEETGISSGTSRRDYFLKGKLYYEANETGPFGFKLALPDDFRTDPSGISSYLESTTSDVLEVRKLIDLGLRQIEDQENNSKSFWKRYCFQTCYGYWAPECHFEDIKIEIEKNVRLRRHLQNTFDALQEKREELWSVLLEICQDLSPNVGNNWPFQSEDSQDLDEEKLHDKWSAWFSILMSKNRSEFIYLLCRNVQCKDARYLGRWRSS